MVRLIAYGQLTQFEWVAYFNFSVTHALNYLSHYETIKPNPDAPDTLDKLASTP